MVSHRQVRSRQASSEAAPLQPQPARNRARGVSVSTARCALAAIGVCLATAGCGGDSFDNSAEAGSGGMSGAGGTSGGTSGTAGATSGTGAVAGLGGTGATGASGGTGGATGGIAGATGGTGAVAGEGGSGGTAGTGAVAGEGGSGGTAGTGAVAGEGGSGGTAGTGAVAGEGGSGGTAGTGGALGGAGGQAGGTGGNAEEPGECSSDNDCPGGTCERIPDEPGGYWACVIPQSPTTQPSENPEEDECTSSDDCESGCECYWFEEYYSGFVHPHNRCVCDECQSDQDCGTDRICVPGGAWNLPRNACITAHCATNADCTREAGGVCVAYFDWCSVYADTIVGKVCHYPTSPCRQHSDCPVEAPACMPSWDNPEDGLGCYLPDCPG